MGMSRLAIHSIVSLFIAALGVAVPAGALEWKLGAQVFSASNTLTGELPDEGDWKGQASVGAGLIAEVNFTEVISISFQPGYMPRNSLQEFEERGLVITSNKYELNYVSLPLLIRVTAKPAGVRGFVTAGLDFGILVDATFASDSATVDIADSLDDTTMGALFGAGALVPVGRHFLSFELRYVQGLEDIVARESNDPDAGLTSSSVKYHGLAVMAGFLFTLGGE